MRRSLPARLATASLVLGGWLGGAPAATATAATPDSGWRWPLAGPVPVPVIRPFAAPADRYAAGHRGVDLESAAGGVVLAPAPGRIAYAGLVAGRGIVTIAHPSGLRSEYEPVRPLVRAGTEVRPGQPVAVLAGHHPGCPGWCLHWGLRRGQAYLDPLSMLAAPTVRLLPLGGRPSVAGTTAPVGDPVAGDAGEPDTVGAGAHPPASVTGTSGWGPPNGARTPAVAQPPEGAPGRRLQESPAARRVPATPPPRSGRTGHPATGTAGGVATTALVAASGLLVLRRRRPTVPRGP